MHWGLLPVVTESMRHNCSFVKGRFTGDPSYEYEHTETKKVENQDGDKIDGAEEDNIVCKVLSCWVAMGKKTVTGLLFTET